MQRRKFTINERVFMIKHYYSENSFRHVSDKWHENFETPCPGKSTVYDLVSKFETTGTVNDGKRSGRPKTATHAENTDLVATCFVNSPKKSIRRASLELDISRSSLQRILHAAGLKPYRPHLMQALNEDDPDRRSQFCETFLAFYEDEPNIVDHIIWSDECCFKLNGFVNRHNCVYWADSNPHEILEKAVNLPGITVWGAISSDGLIGPFFFENTVTGASYLEMLQDKLWPVISQRPDIDTVHFQQDGAPPHYSLIVRNWLDQHFTDRWMGRRGPVEWPARSPDLTPPDFFLWGVLKNSVYAHKPKSINELKACIQREWDMISPDICKKVCRSVIGRFKDCIEADGRHFEHL